MRQTQAAGLEALLRTRTARTGIAAQVGAYIDWVVAHPAMARFLFGMRHAPFLAEDEATIATLNEDMQRRGAQWFADRIAAGELPDLEPAMRWPSCSARAGTGPGRGFGARRRLPRRRPSVRSRRRRTPGCRR